MVSELKDELDERFTRRQWVVQRVGWALMGCVILAAMLGFFGTSPLATRLDRQEVGAAAFEVEHPRFSRYQLIDRIHVRVSAPGAQGHELAIAFSNEYLENNNIRGSSPDADGGGADAHGGVWTYNVTDWSQPVVVSFEVEPRKAFWNPGTLTITAGDLEPVALPLDAWVHP